MAADPYKTMNDVIRKAYERLAADGLIGDKGLPPSFVSMEQQDERGFQHWQNETLMPDVVNRHLKEIGDDVLQ